MSQTVLITGSSTGFGRDTAETLSKEGYKIYASMRDPAGRNNTHANVLKDQGINVIELDVTKAASIENAVNIIEEEEGQLDILINNAGVAAAGISEAFTDKQVQELFDVNVLGVHRTTRAVLPLMRKQKTGLIINIGSILGRVTFPFFGLYGASKFAIEALTEGLRYELSQSGIEVSLLQPSAYPTQMYGSAISPEDLERAEGYGEIGKIPAAMFDQFMEIFQSTESPNPHDVAETILNIINAPAGNRPLRTVVGSSFGAEKVNEATDPIQRQCLEGLGLGFLDTVKLD
ncbi:MAG: SDR family oxidoreductase [Sneathiellales bacterium]|nr:SDR family oxidoreductase [Sneathiellales bacterium]